MTEAPGDQEAGQVIHSAAEVYERFFVPALFQQWPAKLLDAADVASGDRVLDVACGTGVLAREAASRTQGVVGVDLNEAMLAVAREQAPNIGWNCGNAEALPLAEGSFDVVASQFGIMFFEQPGVAVAEMLRVLRAGGRLVVATWDAIERAPGYEAMRDLAVHLFGRRLKSAFDAPFSLGRRSTLRSLFREAGASDVRISAHDGSARYPSIRDWVYTDIKGWTLAGVLTDAQFDLLLREAERTLGRFVAADGSVAFTARALASALETPRLCRGGPQSLTVPGVE